MIFIDNKYTKWYYLIVNNAQQRTTWPAYYETHHIIPRACGGDNSESNLVKLTAKEHFVCHHLLTKMLNGLHKQKMMFACQLMTRKTSDLRYKVTARLYDQFKSCGPWNKGVTGLPGKSPTEKTRQIFRDKYTGVPRPEEVKKNMRKGWAKLKEAGYSPWNKGIPGSCPSRSISCVFISPKGVETAFPSFKQGCIAHGLPTDKISQVNTGLLSDFKGWTVRK